LERRPDRLAPPAPFGGHALLSQQRAVRAVAGRCGLFRPAGTLRLLGESGRLQELAPAHVFAAGRRVQLLRPSPAWVLFLRHQRFLRFDFLFCLRALRFL
jgi:hypothetical protein